MNKVVKIRKGSTYTLSKDEKANFWVGYALPKKNVSGYFVGKHSYYLDLDLCIGDILTIQRNEDHETIEKIEFPFLPALISVDIEKKGETFFYHTVFIEEEDEENIRMVFKEEILTKENLTTEVIDIISYSTAISPKDFFLIMTQRLSEDDLYFLLKLMDKGLFDSPRSLCFLLEMMKREDFNSICFLAFLDYLYFSEEERMELADILLSLNCSFKKEMNCFIHLPSREIKEISRGVFYMKRILKATAFKKLLAAGLLQDAPTFTSIFNFLERKPHSDFYLNRMLSNKAFLKKYKGEEIQTILKALSNQEDFLVFYKYGLDGETIKKNQNLTGVDFLKSLK